MNQKSHLISLVTVITIVTVIIITATGIRITFCTTSIDILAGKVIAIASYLSDPRVGAPGISETQKKEHGQYTSSFLFLITRMRRRYKRLFLDLRV